MILRYWFAALLIVGVVLHGYQWLFIAHDPPLWLFLWLLVPYGIASIFRWRSVSWAPALSGVVIALAVDLWTHYLVFFEAKGSTAGVALLLTPLYSFAYVPVVALVAKHTLLKKETHAV